MNISIIIPTYNREETIEKCINSLSSQLENDVEIIIADDGSSDNTVLICQGLENSNIKLICCEHGGVSSARNNGIAAAKGKYIAFIDSDDFVGDNYIKILKSAIAVNPEIVIFNSFEKQCQDGKFAKAKTNLTVSEICDVSTVYPALIEQKINNVWLKLFRADIISDYGIRFKTNMIIAEDYLFVMDYLRHCSTACIESYLPYYFVYNTSGTYSVKKDYILNVINAYNHTVAFINDKCNQIDDTNMKARFLQQTVEFTGKLYERKMLDDKIISELLDSDLYQTLINSKYKKLKSKIEKRLLTINNWKTNIKYYYTVKALEKIKNHVR